MNFTLNLFSNFHFTNRGNDVYKKMSDLVCFLFESKTENSIKGFKKKTEN